MHTSHYHRLLRAPVATVPTSWLPGTYAGLAAGYTADPTQAVVAGGFLSQWTDRSGNARHLVQATGSAQPAFGLTGGLYGLTFDGANDYLQAAFASLPQPLTVYAVFAMNAGTYLYDDAAANAFSLLYTSGNLRAAAGLANVQYVEAQPIARCQLTLVLNGASSTLRKDGATKVSSDAGANGLNGLTVGAGFNGTANSAGVWHELLVYSAADAVAGAKMLAIEADQKARFQTP